MTLPLCTNEAADNWLPDPGGSWLFVFLPNNPGRIFLRWICPAIFWTHMNCGIRKLALENSCAASLGVQWRSPPFCLLWTHDLPVSFEVPSSCAGRDSEFSHVLQAIYDFTALYHTVADITAYGSSFLLIQPSFLISFLVLLHPFWGREGPVIKKQQLWSYAPVQTCFVFHSLFLS